MVLPICTARCAAVDPSNERVRTSEPEARTLTAAADMMGNKTLPHLTVAAGRCTRGCRKPQPSAARSTPPCVSMHRVTAGGAAAEHAWQSRAPVAREHWCRLDDERLGRGHVTACACTHQKALAAVQRCRRVRSCAASHAACLQDDGEGGVARESLRRAADREDATLATLSDRSRDMVSTA